MMNEENRFEVELKKIAYLYDNLLSAFAAIFGLTVIVFLAFKDRVDPINLYVWCGVSVVVLIIRFFFLKLYKKSEIRSSNLFKYYIMYYIGLIVSGVVWSSSVFFIFPKDIEYQLLLLLLTGGLLSGAAVSIVSKVEMFYSYLLIMIVPFMYIFITKDTQISSSIFTALLFYILLLTLISRKSSENVNNNIILAFENKKLIGQLEDKVQEAKSANAAKSKFLSVVSHEIRTPLNAIIGFIKILKHDEKDSKKLTYIDTIDKSSYLLLNVINDVLDISKIESGKFTIDKSDFNPREELCQVYELFEQAGKEKEINFINSASDDLPKYIRSDKLRLKQIVSNLLSNAVKFTPKNKSIELIVTFSHYKSTLNIEVRDEGVGIEEKNISNILEEFTQADSSTARKYGGTGLGLSIVTKLLELLGTKLNVESKVNVGSSFSFELPVEVLEDVVEEKNIDDENEVDFNLKRVLVAEDNKTNQMLIDILLDDLNLDVTMANDGLEAEELFKKGEFDIVLMDINMPNKNGKDAMLSIKEYEKSLNRFTPVVALTANAVSGDKERYIEDGFDDYIAKPIDNKELERVLQKYL